MSQHSKNNAFQQRRRCILEALSGNAGDKSRKGSVDERALGVIALINERTDMYTTSSCSGRISVLAEPTPESRAQGKKGGEWVYTTHDEACADEVVRSVKERCKSGAKLILRFEPFLLHAECEDMEAAGVLLQAARLAGFRESGATIGSSGSRVMVGIRCSLRLEAPVADAGRLLVSEDHIRYLVAFANDKFEANTVRIKSLEQQLSAMPSAGAHHAPRAGQQGVDGRTKGKSGKAGHKKQQQQQQQPVKDMGVCTDTSTVQDQPDRTAALRREDAQRLQGRCTEACVVQGQPSMCPHRSAVPTTTRAASPEQAPSQTHEQKQQQHQHQQHQHHQHDQLTALRHRQVAVLKRLSAVERKASKVRKVREAGAGDESEGLQQQQQRQSLVGQEVKEGLGMIKGGQRKGAAVPGATNNSRLAGSGGATSRAGLATTGGAAASSSGASLEASPSPKPAPGAAALVAQARMQAQLLEEDQQTVLRLHCLPMESSQQGFTPEALLRWGHACVSWRGLVVAVGGYGGSGTHKRRADVLVYDPQAPSNNRWRVIEANGPQGAPEPRMGHAAVLLGDSLVLISGRTSPTRPLNDVWMLHLPTMVWTPTTTTVVGAEHDEGVLEGDTHGWPGRYRHSAVVDPTLLTPYHPPLLDTTSSSCTSISTSSKGLGHIGGDNGGSAYSVVVFGGRDAHDVRDDLWVLRVPTDDATQNDAHSTRDSAARMPSAAAAAPSSAPPSAPLFSSSSAFRNGSVQMGLYNPDPARPWTWVRIPRTSPSAELHLSSHMSPTGILTENKVQAPKSEGSPALCAPALSSTHAASRGSLVSTHTDSALTSFTSEPTASNPYHTVTTIAPEATTTTTTFSESSTTPSLILSAHPSPSSAHHAGSSAAASATAVDPATATSGGPGVGTWPSRRKSHAAAVLHGHMYVHGGTADYGGQSCEMLRMDLQAVQQAALLLHAVHLNKHHLASPPTASDHHHQQYQCLEHQQQQQYQEQQQRLVHDACSALWTEVPPHSRCPAPACFSHSLTPCGDRFLALLGGWPTEQHNRLFLFDTVCAKWVSLPLQLPCDLDIGTASVTFLPIRHTAVVVPSSEHPTEQLVMLGGGAFCFSFGSCFSGVYGLDLEEVGRQALAVLEKPITNDNTTTSSAAPAAVITTPSQAAAGAAAGNACLASSAMDRRGQAPTRTNEAHGQAHSNAPPHTPAEAAPASAATAAAIAHASPAHRHHAAAAAAAAAEALRAASAAFGTLTLKHGSRSRSKSASPAALTHAAVPAPPSHSHGLTQNTSPQPPLAPTTAAAAAAAAGTDQSNADSSSGHLLSEDSVPSGGVHVGGAQNGSDITNSQRDLRASGVDGAPRSENRANGCGDTAQGTNCGSSEGNSRGSAGRAGAHTGRGSDGGDHLREDVGADVAPGVPDGEADLCDMGWALQVAANRAKPVKDALKAAGWLDTSRKAGALGRPQQQQQQQSRGQQRTTSTAVCVPAHQPVAPCMPEVVLPLTPAAVALLTAFQDSLHQKQQQQHNQQHQQEVLQHHYQSDPTSADAAPDGAKYAGEGRVPAAAAVETRSVNDAAAAAHDPIPAAEEAAAEEAPPCDPAVAQNASAGATEDAEEEAAAEAAALAEAEADAAAIAAPGDDVLPYMDSITSPPPGSLLFPAEPVPPSTPMSATTSFPTPAAHTPAHYTASATPPSLTSTFAFPTSDPEPTTPLSIANLYSLAHSLTPSLSPPILPAEPVPPPTPVTATATTTFPLAAAPVPAEPVPPATPAAMFMPTPAEPVPPLTPDPTWLPERGASPLLFASAATLPGLPSPAEHVHPSLPPALTAAAQAPSAPATPPLPHAARTKPQSRAGAHAVPLLPCTSEGALPSTACRRSIPAAVADAMEAGVAKVVPYSPPGGTPSHAQPSLGRPGTSSSIGSGSTSSGVGGSGSGKRRGRRALSPHAAMAEAVRGMLPPSTPPELVAALLSDLPTKWERLGNDVALIPEGSMAHPAWEQCVPHSMLWPKLAEALAVTRIARQAAVANTGTRDSRAQLLLGNDGWVTHAENRCLFVLDVTRCMYSSGNVTERARMGKLHGSGQVVVDLYAGIGYYTLPLLVNAKVQKVYACEWNPHAVEALRKGLVANGVAHRCKVLPGDCTQVAPVGVADRVMLGLLPSSEESWPTAVAALKNTGGWLHVHGNVLDSEEGAWAEHVVVRLQDLANATKRVLTANNNNNKNNNNTDANRSVTKGNPRANDGANPDGSNSSSRPPWSHGPHPSTASINLHVRAGGSDSSQPHIGKAEGPHRSGSGYRAAGVEAGAAAAAAEAADAEASAMEGRGAVGGAPAAGARSATATGVPGAEGAGADPANHAGEGPGGLGEPWGAVLHHIERVKWYAPRIRHLVLDIELRPLSQLSSSSASPSSTSSSNVGSRSIQQALQGHAHSHRSDNDAPSLHKPKEKRVVIQEADLAAPEEYQLWRIDRQRISCRSSSGGVLEEGDEEEQVPGSPPEMANPAAHIQVNSASAPASHPTCFSAYKTAHTTPEMSLVPNDPQPWCLSHHPGNGLAASSVGPNDDDVGVDVHTTTSIIAGGAHTTTSIGSRHSRRSSGTPGEASRHSRRSSSIAGEPSRLSRRSSREVATGATLPLACRSLSRSTSCNGEDEVHDDVDDDDVAGSISSTGAVSHTTTHISRQAIAVEESQGGSGSDGELACGGADWRRRSSSSMHAFDGAGGEMGCDALGGDGAIAMGGSRFMWEGLTQSSRASDRVAVGEMEEEEEEEEEDLNGEQGSQCALDSEGFGGGGGSEAACLPWGCADGGDEALEEEGEGGTYLRGEDVLAAEEEDLLAMQEFVGVEEGAVPCERGMVQDGVTGHAAMDGMVGSDLYSGSVGSGGYAMDDSDDGDGYSSSRKGLAGAQGLPSGVEGGAYTGEAGGEWGGDCHWFEMPWQSLQHVHVTEVSGSLTRETFEAEVSSLREPVLLRGMDLGPCVHKWTAAYLANLPHTKDTPVSVHVTRDPSGSLDFVHKNFVYRTMPFGDLMARTASLPRDAPDGGPPTTLPPILSPPDTSSCSAALQQQQQQQQQQDQQQRVEAGESATESMQLESHHSNQQQQQQDQQPYPERYYLRSMGSDPRKEPSNLEASFPELAADVTLPPLFPPETFFSSVMRISSPGLRLWTHYDVMDNMLLQVRGVKRALLWPPLAAEDLYTSGSSSPITNLEHPDLERYPRFAAAVPILAVLFPGDTLFIPALWHHNVQTCSLDEARAFFPGAVATGSHDGQQARLISLAPTGDSSSMRGSEAGGGGESLSAGGCEGSHSGAGNGGDGGGKNDGGGGADNGFSISVNVFWRHLDASFYPRKDVYGNKDLVQATAADAAAENVIQALQQLPPHSEYRAFYTQRLLCRIMRDVHQNHA